MSRCPSESPTLAVSNTTTSFHSSSFLVGRSEELLILEDAINAVKDNNAKHLILLEGPSGSGKTSLVAAVRRETEQKCFWASGKFHQSSPDSNESSIHINEEQESFSSSLETRPYSALLTVLTDLCHSIAATEEDCSSLIEGTRARLLQVLSQQELGVLQKVIPAIQILFVGQEVEEEKEELRIQQNATTPRTTSYTLQIFIDLVRRLLSALATLDRPLVLFLDDLQWADPESNHLLTKLIHEAPLPNLLWIGAMRLQQVQCTDPHQSSVTTVPFSLATSSSYTSSWRTQTLTLGSLDMEHVNELVAGRLSRHSMETRELADWVFHRTLGGNPHYCIQCLDWLHRKGLLVKSGGRDWAWDMEKIRAQQSSFGLQTVSALYSDTLQAVPEPVQAVLRVASVVGFQFPVRVLEHVFQNQQLIQLLSEQEGRQAFSVHNSVADFLQQASIAGLIESLQPSKCQYQGKHQRQLGYQFTHDRAQQAASESLSEMKNGDSIRATVGRVLLRLYRQEKPSRGNNSWVLFTATNLLIKYAPSGSLNTKECRIKLAELCLEAANMAAQQSAFASAGRYADAGSDYIESFDPYPLNLELFCLSAEMHFAHGDLSNCEKRVSKARAASRKPSDTFRATRVLLDTMAARDDWAGIIELSMAELSALGVVNVPRTANKMSVIKHLLVSKYMLKRRSPKQLEELPYMSDELVIQSCKLLRQLAHALYRTANKNLWTVTLNLTFQLTLKHGIGELAPAGMVSFALSLTVLHQYKDAFAFYKSAKAILERPESNSRQHTSRVYFGMYSTLSHLGEAPRRIVQGSLRGFTCGIQYGEVFFACCNLMIRMGVGSFACMRLDDHYRFVHSAYFWCLWLGASG